MTINFGLRRIWVKIVTFLHKRFNTSTYRAKRQKILNRWKLIYRRQEAHNYRYQFLTTNMDSYDKRARYECAKSIGAEDGSTDYFMLIYNGGPLSPEYLNWWNTAPENEKRRNHYVNTNHNISMYLSQWYRNDTASSAFIEKHNITLVEWETNR